MIRDYYEDLTLIERTATPDGMGGTVTTVTGGTAFRGGVYIDSSKAALIADKQDAKTIAVIMTDIMLHVGDVVRRERDSMLMRVMTVPKAAPDNAVGVARYVTQAEVIM